MLSERFDGLRLCLSLGAIGLDEVLQEGIHVIGRLGHGVLERVSSIIGIAHQFALLGTELGNLADKGKGVMLVGTVSTMDGSLVDTLAQVAIVETGKDGLLGGVDDDDGVGCLSATTLSIFLALGDIGLTETSQVFFLIYPHHSVVGGCLKLITPLLLEIGDTEVDLFHTGHLIVGKQGTVAHEILINLFEELLILWVRKRGGGCLVVHLFDAFEEGLVEGDLVREIGQHGLYLLLDLRDLIILIGLGEGEEHATYTIERATTLLESKDGVLKGGRIRALHNLLDILARLCDSGLEGGQIIGGLDFTEVGGSEGELAFRKERVLCFSLLTGCHRHHHA